MVSDPDMDMNRVVGRPGVGQNVRMIAAALRWFAPGLNGTETPRRSVDRELEQFSSSRQ
jgi:hypothetical protein